MNEDVRLAQVTDSLARVGMRFLVMGGHAVRHYGVMRHTIDIDLHVSGESHQDLVSSLARSALFGGRPPLEGPSWRPADFRRFLLGRLPDGREEWLEFWLRNHLLAPFEALYERREMAVEPGSARHHALVEAVRRVYRQGAMSADRADKLRASGVRSKNT